MVTASHDTLLHLAFNNSLQANIISTVSDGKIIIANKAACKLLGYSEKQLLAKTRAAVFDMNESSFNKMLKVRAAEGRSAAVVVAVKKDGRAVPCRITSAIFTDEAGVERAITTISDLSESILKQAHIDSEKAREVADNIVLAKSKQKGIDARKEKIVADDIIVAQEKSDSRMAENKERVEQENKVKEMQFADAVEDARETERSDIGQELHDNVNQLLGVSRLYIDMAKKGGEKSEIYLNRSSEYTLTAIEEIRKMTKRLTTGILNNLGLYEAIRKLTEDAMEVSPVKISCTLESLIEHKTNDQFKHNVFRIVQEQLNNILTHAKASKAEISLSQNKKTIVLVISDNGKGFDTGGHHSGIGMANIKSRAASFKGTADFVSRPGKGCILTVTFSVTDMLLNKG